MVTIFVADIPEFAPLWRAAGAEQGCLVRSPVGGYWRIESQGPIEFSRRKLKLGPALWNSALSGGFRGCIVEYSRDTMRLESEPAPNGDAP